LKRVYKAREKGKKISVGGLLGEERYGKLLKKDYSEGEKVIKELNKFKTKVFSIFGNGDWYKVFFNDYGRYYEKLIKKLKFVKDINRGKDKFKGFKLVGFGGYIDNDIYFTKKGVEATGEDVGRNRKRRKRYLQEKKRFMKLMKNKPDILLTHYTPYKCLDKMRAKGFALTGGNMGISFFNNGIKRYSPLLVVCGHMHENQGKCRIRKSLVVNPGAASEGKAAVIELEKNKVKNVKFLR